MGGVHAHHRHPGHGQLTARHAEPHAEGARGAHDPLPVARHQRAIQLDERGERIHVRRVGGPSERDLDRLEVALDVTLVRADLDHGAIIAARYDPRMSDHADAGLFGPGSASWRIDREVLVLAGGTCALLMQLAHPAVAAGVAEHSDFRSDPFARLRRTLTASYAVVFGSTARAERAIRRMNAIHAAVRGVVPESGQPYDARDPQLLLWVHGTLVDTALRVYDRFIAPLGEAEAQAYHAESRQIAIRLGVPDAAVPEGLDELRAKMGEMIRSGEVAVSETARLLAPSVLYPTRFPPRLVWDAAHLISLSVLPDPLRRGYGLGWSPARERGVRRLAGVSRRVLPLIPTTLRHVPQAQRAERRIGIRLG